MMHAAVSGDLKVARLLCEAVADKDKAFQVGTTALYRASTHGHLEVARLLCKAGAHKQGRGKRKWCLGL